MGNCSRCNCQIDFNDFYYIWEKMKDLPDPLCFGCARSLYDYIKYLNSSQKIKAEIELYEKENQLINLIFGIGNKLKYNEQHSANNVQYWSLIFKNRIKNSIKVVN